MSASASRRLRAALPGLVLSAPLALAGCALPPIATILLDGAEAVAELPPALSRVAPISGWT